MAIKTVEEEEEYKDTVDETDECECPDKPAPQISEVQQEPQIQEETNLGRFLFLTFLRTRIRHLEISLPEDFPGIDKDINIPQEKLSNWNAVGQILSDLADSFEHSRERTQVLQLAQNVLASSLNLRSLPHLIPRIFQGGKITRERIIVFFCFCADLAVELLKRGLGQGFADLMMWSVEYLISKITPWVHRHGGWRVVLESALSLCTRLCIIIACVAFTAACFVYWRKNG